MNVLAEQGGRMIDMRPLRTEYEVLVTIPVTGLSDQSYLLADV